MNETYCFYLKYAKISRLINKGHTLQLIVYDYYSTNYRIRIINRHSCQWMMMSILCKARFNPSCFVKHSDPGEDIVTTMQHYDNSNHLVIVHMEVL
jgi:hypothetical protein